MCDLPHTALKGGPRLSVIGFTVSAADPNASFAQLLDCFEGTADFRRERDDLNDFGKSQKLVTQF